MAYTNRPQERDWQLRIDDLVARLDGMIRDVLVYSRAATGAITIAPVDVGSMIGDLIESHPSFRGRVQVEGLEPFTRSGDIQCRHPWDTSDTVRRGRTIGRTARASR